MSESLGDQTLLACGTCTTPTTGDVLWILPAATYNYLLIATVVTAKVAGAQAASTFRIQTLAPATILDCIIGTTDANGTVTALCTTANSRIAAGTALKAVHVTTDASAVYFWQIFGTILHN